MSKFGPLTQEERDLVKRLLSQPELAPPEFKSWVRKMIEADPPDILWSDIVSKPILYPWHIDIDPFTTATTHTNWDTLGGPDASALYNGWKQSTGAQNAEIGWDVVMDGGTWTVELTHIRGSNRGQYYIYFDGVFAGFVEGYNATNQYNHRTAVTGIFIATAGKKRFTIKMENKHASSSSYLAYLQHVQIRKTS